MKRYITPAFCFLLLFLCNAHCAVLVSGPKPFDQILTSSFSTDWTAGNATAVSSIANLKHVIFLDAATKTMCLSIDTSNSRDSGLTVTPAGNITANYGSAMRCMFHLRDRNIESLSTTSLNGNYSIHPELFSYSAIDGNATATAVTASSALVRDVKSYYRAVDASYLVFTFVGNATSTKIKAATRLVLSSGNFSASGNWSASHWVSMNGTSVSLTTNEANATSFFVADATELIDFGVPAGSDFNPNGTTWQNNAFAANPTSPAPWSFDSSALISSANNGLIKNVDPAYSAQLNHSAAATLAAESALENIRISLVAQGESLRYDKEVYLAFRENALSHLFASGDIYNGQVGNRTVAHVYFTNAYDDDGVNHPYMVIATHNATPRPNFLVDVARPPGDGVGSGYANQSVTRTAVLEAKTIVVPLKDYGLITNLTDNTVSPSLASDANLSAGNYTTENYADNASSGIAIDGVKIYPALNNTLEYAPVAAEITSSGAHVGRGGSLHWHADGHGFNGNGINLYNLADYADSQGTAAIHPPIIGFSYDGIAIYGKYEASFSSMEGYSESLDDYGGHTHGDYGYHYHAHAMPVENGSNDFTQHYFMVGAWKGQINDLPVMGEADISVKPGETETTQRYVGKNGTAANKPVVMPQTIAGIVGNALATNITAAYSPTNYVLASGSWPAGLSLNSTTGVISGTPTESANGTVLVVRATNATGNGTGNVTLTIAKGSQTISGVASTLSKEVGSAAYSLNATVSSNLTLSYASSNESVAIVAANGAVSVVGSGTATLTVSQGGDNNYNAATSVTQELTVTGGLAAPVVTSATITGTVGVPLNESITATNSPTNYALVSGSWPAGLSLNSTSGVISGTPTESANGTVLVVRATNASGNGTGNVTLTIAKGSQTISGVASTLSNEVGSAAYSLNATVSSNLTLSYASSNESVAKVAANGTVSVVGTGTATLTVSQGGDNNYNAATSVTQMLTITAAAISPSSGASGAGVAESGGGGSSQVQKVKKGGKGKSSAKKTGGGSKKSSAKKSSGSKKSGGKKKKRG